MESNHSSQVTTPDRQQQAPVATFRHTELADGATLWRLARDSKTLDLNTSYAYVMWADQFSQSTLIAEVDGVPAGFLLGFRPPKNPDALFVWQIAVAERFRGMGLAGRLLLELARRMGVRHVEATVAPDNLASQKLFRGFARRTDCECQESPYIETEHFPDSGHPPEHSFRIGPFQPQQ